MNSSWRLHEGSFRTDETQKQGRDIEWLFWEHVNSQILTMSLSSSNLPNGGLCCLDQDTEPTELTDSLNLALHAANKNVESHFAKHIIQCVPPTTFGSLYANSLISKILVII